MHVTWNCNQNSTRPGPFLDPEDARCDLAEPEGANGQVFLGAHIDFPTCFSGTLNLHNVVGNTADFHGGTGNPTVDRLAYPTGTRTNPTCPAGFPRKLPHLRLAISWDYQGDGSDLALSSDHEGHRFSMHSDFWNTWVQSGLQSMITRCVNTTTAHPHGNQNICGQ